MRGSPAGNRKPIDTSKPRKRAGVGERDRRDFPGFYNSGLWLSGSGGVPRPGFFKPGAPKEPTNERVCTGPITYTGQAAIAKDIDAMKMGLDGKSAEDGFIAVPRPAEPWRRRAQRALPGRDRLHDGRRRCVRKNTRRSPTPASSCRSTSRNSPPPGCSIRTGRVEEYRKYLDFAVEVINHAIRGLPRGTTAVPHVLGLGPPPARP